MRIAIYGSGSVGGYFGGRLAQAGEEVSFIARGQHLQAMQQNGLRVDSLKGDFVVKPVQATDDPQQLGEVDAVIVGVKAWQVPEAAKNMRPLIGEGTCVLPLQNGVDAPAQLAAELGEEHVLGGLCQISSLVAGPGHIRHVGLEPLIALGELDDRTSERVERLREALERAGVKVDVPENIQAAMWRKFLFIASISGVGAVTRAPVGVMRSIPETRGMLEQSLQEVYAIAKERKVALPEDVVEKTMAFIDGLGAGVVASMQRDIMEGRPSELEAQNGAVVRMGAECGVPTPLNNFLYSSLLPQERKARGEGR